MSLPRREPHPAIPWQLKELFYAVRRPRYRGYLKCVAARSGFAADSISNIFSGRVSPKFHTVETLFNACHMTLMPIPKDRLDDVRKYLSRPTTGT